PDTGGRMNQLAKQQLIFDWIERGLLKVEPLISHRLPPAQIKIGYEGLRTEPERFTGVLLNWKED
ncbi:MAG TPA: hypothetical protein VGP93_07120, partial [Polyangiaceae bacterium]|nr:hypothetical protein [Polyangiaceae bacterium]